MVPAIKFTICSPDADGDVPVQLVFFGCCMKHTAVLVYNLCQTVKEAMQLSPTVYCETDSDITREFQTELLLAAKEAQSQSKETSTLDEFLKTFTESQS